MTYRAEVCAISAVSSGCWLVEKHIPRAGVVAETDLHSLSEEGKNDVLARGFYFTQGLILYFFL